MSTALGSVYWPFLYLEKVKKKESRYFLRVILGDDFLVIFLAFSLISNQPLIHGIGILFFLLSFWCIYEVGYIENDLVAEKYEDKPILSNAYQKNQEVVNWWLPWLWSLMFAIIASFFLKINQDVNNLWEFNANFIWDINGINFIADILCKWIVLLFFLRTFYWIYNHLNKQTRIWFYFILQAFRYFSFLVVSTTNLMGAVILFIQVLARSIPYLIYRYLGGNKNSWPVEFPIYFFRLLIYILLITALSCGLSDFSLSTITSPQVLLFVLLCLLRGTKNIQQIMIQIKPVWQDGSN